MAGLNREIEGFDGDFPKGECLCTEATVVLRNVRKGLAD